MTQLLALRWCLVVALAVGYAAAMNSTVPANKTGNLRVEDSMLPGTDISNKWGVQRAVRTPYWWRPIDRLDSWMTIWNTIVNTRRATDAGGKVWHALKSNGSPQFDMLRNVQDDLCLDAWWNDYARKPFVHGYKCSYDEPNQRWSFELPTPGGPEGVKICSKRHPGWCLAISAFGDSYMEPSWSIDDNLMFAFRPWLEEF
ncbi:hypothetical protein SPRG_14714 [Saprolegnia parasitica CBS 223.65]|uniref:Uncharacterized protein n=1 Tax=Saprolegnia parasitica (strain CBS 223.65) TaxID=695850 RepID=A0A067BKT5_SAPPC|nr:hypothetical protein SPRG_14714 [Saprolegnia parasitica CBS 223.65]KDO19079.1 hypothetical protein SPRG_14714 [Saprolegnia parasitica CBS 223.65]|eukprot:XP_012210206.1 hypothetical protein SPRG_14714 [Saprolegnia parasitica CBS 223.65]